MDIALPQADKSVNLHTENEERIRFLRSYFLRYVLYAFIPSVVLGIIGGLGVGEIVWRFCSWPCSYAGLLLRMPGFLWGSMLAIVVVHIFFIWRERKRIPAKFSVGTLWLTWSIAFLLWVNLNQFSERIILTF